MPSRGYAGSSFAKRASAWTIDRLRVVTDLTWETDVLWALLALLAAVAAAGGVLLLFRLASHRASEALEATVRDAAVLAALAVILAATLLTPLGSVRQALAQIVANMALFVPLGMSLQWRFWPFGALHAGGVGTLLSVTIELLQGITGGGRWVETTDVITNTLGAMLGASILTGAGALRRRL
jgi:glycopeptide antibiotics resistance protein